MSLKIWLPLNGNIENQGVSNIPIINNGVTFVDGGKIGNKCASFNNNYFSLQNLSNFNTISVSFWMKPSNTSQTGCLLNYRTGVGADLAIFLIDGKIRFDAGGITIFNYTYTTDWQHITVTYDGNVKSLYINGILNQSVTVNKAISCSATKGTVGASSANTTSGNSNNYIGLLNDYRIYDHCLSPKEVKEISRGMVLHYKMCGNTQVPNNCYSNPTFDTSNSDGGWGHWTASGGSGSFAQNTDKNFIFRLGQTYSHKVVCDSSATYDYLCYQEPAFSGGYRSMCAIIKAFDGTKITENICYPTWNSRNGGVENNKWTSVNKLRDGFYLCKCEGIKQDGSNDLVGIYVKPGKTIYISECYLENNYERCSDFWTRTNIEYDGSGFKNHGTVFGNVTLSADSPRYTGSYKFGTNNYITTTSTGNYIKSATFWAKDAGSVPSDGLVFRDQNSGLAFGIQSGNLITGAVGGPAGSSSVPVSVSDAKYTANTWHFFACVNDNGTHRLYMDGMQISTGTGTGNWSQGSPTNSLNVGGRAGSSYWPGYISDFKMYVTVLSAIDVQELYKLGRI